MAAIPANNANRPNVLLLIADDWSPLARCYGNAVVHTPHIDRLADRGTVFDHAFCITPSCAASRASILTGRYTHTHGQYGHPHGRHGFNTFRDVVSLPRVLNDHGYRTANIGKHHVKPDEVYPFHLCRTFDSWSSRSMAGGFEGFLNDIGDAPFFAMYAPMYPHRRGEGSKYHLEHCPEEFNDKPIDPADVIVPPFLPDIPEVRDDLAAYYQAVARYDHCVGEALRVLEASGRAENTLVLVLSDHGMPFPGAKASPFDTGHHCPLIVHHPGGARQGDRSAALVNWTDLMPTVLQWCGVPESDWPEPLHGRSLLPLLEGGEADDAWAQTYWSHCAHGITEFFPYRVLREHQYKYIRNLAHETTMPMPIDLFDSSTWQGVRQRRVAMLGERSAARLFRHDPEGLYDIQADPMETRNLIDDPAQAETADRMRRAVRRMRERTEDPWLELDRQHENTPWEALMQSPD